MATNDADRRLNLLVLRVRSGRNVGDEMTKAPLSWAEAPNLDEIALDRALERPIRVGGAGDARANGVYIRHGRQNNAPRWRHLERSWLCILRDGNNWWIGNERAATEDLYWCEASGWEREWRVCPCDDSTHRHFRGSAPPPTLSWAEDETQQSSSSPRGIVACEFYAEAIEECPICLSALQDATRTPCGHVACAWCLARTRTALRTRDVEADMRCPLCRAPFTLAGALHVSSNKPILEALPKLEADVNRFSSSLSLPATIPRTSSRSDDQQTRGRLAQLWFAITACRRSLRSRQSLPRTVDSDTTPSIRNAPSGFELFLRRSI